MAKIALYLSVLAIVLPNIISAWFPGDGCCIRWDRDGTCCMNIRGQCCGDRGWNNNLDFNHPHGPHRRLDGRFDGSRGGFNRDRWDKDSGNSFGRDDRHSGEGNNRQGGGRFGGNNVQGGGQFGENNGQGTRRNNNQGNGQSGGNNNKGTGESGGNNSQGTGGNKNQGSGQSGEGSHQSSSGGRGGGGRRGNQNG